MTIETAIRSRAVWFYGVLVLAVLAVYGRILQHDFVAWDDGGHITNNPHLDPVSWQSLARFWREPYFFHYVPVSYTFFTFEAWLAQSSRNELGELQFKAWVFHAGSLLLHLACVLLVYRLLLTMSQHSVLGTQYSVPSASRLGACFGALLFALHPLQVESVAWISETRGLLAACFSLLSLLAYENLQGRTPRQRGSWIWYLLATACFVLALLSKPSAVTLPLLVLVWDIGVHRRVGTSIVLMLPWLALAAVGSAWTSSEQPSERQLFVTPLWARPLIAADALAFYMGKLVWPSPLGILYPRSPEYVMRQGWFWATWLAPAAVLVFLLWRKSRVGLLAFAWFIAALLPVLGLATFNFQAYSTVADRYVYLALLGPACALAAWIAAAAMPVRVGVAAAALCLCAALSVQQSATWRNTEALFQQALVAHPASDVAHLYLSTHYSTLGETAKSQWHLDRVLELNPRSAMGHFNRAINLMNAGQLEAAAQAFELALSLDPKLHMAHLNLGVLHFEQGRIDEAIPHFQAVLQVDPANPGAGLNLALALERKGETDVAIEQLQQVVRKVPNDYQCRTRLGILLAGRGDIREAIGHFTHVLAMRDDISVHAELASALIRDGQFSAGLHHYGEALRTPSPLWPQIAGRLAWLLATHPSDEVRNGQQAVILAAEACRQAGDPRPELLQSLAAAKAEIGDFEEAVSNATQAHKLAIEMGQTGRATSLASQLDHYRDRRPFRDVPGGAAAP